MRNGVLLWLMWTKSLFNIHLKELLNSSSVILKNVYEFFKFPGLGSISRYGILIYIISNVSSLYMTQQAGKETNFNKSFLQSISSNSRYKYSRLSLKFCVILNWFKILFFSMENIFFPIHC